jgi:hypothetical protein
VQAASIDDLAGFRRRVIITPGADRVVSELEDDYHCMGVTVYHDRTFAKSLEPVMARAPWSTCPGAIAALKQTFTGIALDKFAARGQKRTNCTHLHDLALLAAAHAFDRESLTYDILVSDPVAGSRRSELRRNGTALLRWNLVDGRFVEPAAMAGLELGTMRNWIDSLGPEQQETARLLRWGTMISEGRSLSIEWTPAGGGMTDSCYSFQALRINEAQRLGSRRDFSSGTARPLEQRPVTRASVPPNSTHTVRQDNLRAGLPEGGHHEDE